MFNIQIILQEHERLQKALNQGDITPEQFARIFNVYLRIELNNIEETK